MSESTSIKLADGLKERLRAVAEARQHSVNRVMNDAIRTYVEREEGEAQLRAELERRVREVRETGRHVTHEDALDWLLRRSRGENVPAPKAHE